MGDAEPEQRGDAGTGGVQRGEPSDGARDDSLQGTVIEVLPRALYRVELESRERILAHPSHDARRNFVRILKGDRVAVARSPRNRMRGRITARLAGS